MACIINRHPPGWCGGEAHRPVTVRDGRGRNDFARCRKARGKGFTLIELLTVITILAILATLLMTTLSSVKRKAREAVCTSNLHQIGLALQIYLDDFHERPPDLKLLVASKYLGDGKILRCPADRTPSTVASLDPFDTKSNSSPLSNATLPPHVSYESPLSWPDAEWSRLMQLQTRAGVVVCRYHDVRPPALSGTAEMEPAAGLILRGQLDGSVVRRQYYPPTVLLGARGEIDSAGAPPTASFGGEGSPATTADGAAPPWEYFSDDPAP